MSYTLYAVHYPMLFLIHALWLGNQKLPYSSAGIATPLTIAGAAFIFAYGWWWLFERRTNEVRDFFRRRLPGGLH
jgi:peptidoglycan/LPS O-acetylase OafA/YrhL